MKKREGVIMHKEELENEFTKRYNAKKGELQSFIMCPGLVLCGKGFEKINKSIYSCALSPATYVTLKITDNGIFSIQMTDNNEQYDCENEKLTEYDGDKKIAEIYRCIDKCKGNINGAQILFSFDADSKNFKRCSEAVIAAFDIINYGYIREENKYFNHKENNMIFPAGEFFAKKNLLYGIDNNNKTEYVPFILNEKKIIITTADIKQEDITDKIKTAYENIKEKISDMRDEKNINGYEPQNSVENYIIKEIIRTKNIINLLYEKKQDEIQTFFEEGALEFFSVMEKTGKKLLKLYEIIKGSGKCELIFPAYGYNAIAAVVRDENIDKFIEMTTEVCERDILGTPSFYICDTATGATEYADD